MKILPAWCSLAVLPALLFAGCMSLPGKAIDPNSLRPPAGSRILLCRAERRFFFYEIHEFGRVIELPGVALTGPPRQGIRGPVLVNLVNEMLRETPSHMVLVVNPVSRVLKEYNPYSVFRGWRTRTIFDGTVDGRAIYRTIDEPVFETLYENRCVRTTYRLLQYGKTGEFGGSLVIEDPDFGGCPASSDKDLLFDEIDYFVTWLRSAVSGDN